MRVEELHLKVLGINESIMHLGFDNQVGRKQLMLKLGVAAGRDKEHRQDDKITEKQRAVLKPGDHSQFDC